MLGLPPPCPRARARGSPGKYQTSESVDRVQGLGLRVSSFGFRGSGFELRISRFGYRASGFRFRASGFGFRTSGFDLWISSCGVRISGFGFRALVSGFELRVSGQCLRRQQMRSPRQWKMIRYLHSTDRSPGRLIPPATYGVTSRPP